MITGLRDIINASSRDVLWDIHRRSMESYGFDRIIYGFTRVRSEMVLGDFTDMVLLSNYDDKYLEGFIDSGLYRSSSFLFVPSSDVMKNGRYS